LKHVIIGTAGHVDHGKTVLIKALTGTDTDRLKEEKERGISIELGFAYLRLPSGITAGIIDVPGHERFIKNMLAGVGGIDLVLLVIAADEGVMPQTREHLEIIQLLQVKKGVVVITKKDLVDQEWLELVQEEVQEFLAGTVLEKAPVLPVSAVTGEGLNRLLDVLDQMAGEMGERKYFGPTRMPVDRVFTVTGFGTVATGTLLSGRIQNGDSLQIYPGDKIARVRNIQVHGNKVDEAEAGQRVAVNLSGVETSEMGRGCVLAKPGSLQPSHRIDVKLTFLPSAPKPLKHRARVRAYLGTAEILGRVILLDREELQPGAEAYAQLQLEKPAAASRGDHFVIRSYSPMRTIGGGLIINPAPPKHKRYRDEVIRVLATAEKGSPAEVLEQHMAAKPRIFTKAELVAETGMGEKEIKAALRELIQAHRVIMLTAEEENYYLAERVLSRWEQLISSELAQYHKKFPLRDGFPKEELRSRFFTGLNAKQFQALLNHLAQKNSINVLAHCIAAKGFQPQPAPAQKEKINRLENIFLSQPFQPPNWRDATRQAGLPEEEQEILNYLLARGVLVKVSEGLYFHRQALHEAIKLVKDYIRANGRISLGETRDLLQTSRKYTLPLLEYMDREKITRRVEDMRVAGKSFNEGPEV